MTLRQYVLEILREHCRQPTVNEWLDGLGRLTPAVLDHPAMEAVRLAREEDEAALADEPGRS